MSSAVVGRHASTERSAGSAPGVQPDCPKRMIYGPCGGVRASGGCELNDDLPCPFVGAPLPQWPAPLPEPVQPSFIPRILTDLRVRAYDIDSIRQVGSVLSSVADAVLVGDHQNRPDFPPSFVAALLLDVGAQPWAVLTCRDRNRIALEAEAAALAALGVLGVHCVTGDARGSGVRRDADGVFELDALRLTAIAARLGLAVSVAATPTAPPTDIRPARLHQKERAGASLAIVNYAGGPSEMRRFAEAVKAAGCSMPLIACIPVFTDAGSAAILDGFPGVTLDRQRVREVLAAADPVEAGINAAVDEACETLAGGAIAGVDLSGAATTGDETTSASILAEIAQRLRGRLGS